MDHVKKPYSGNPAVDTLDIHGQCMLGVEGEVNFQTGQVLEVTCPVSIRLAAGGTQDWFGRDVPLEI